MTLTLVTGNPNKAKEYVAILGAEVVIQAVEGLHEIQSYVLEEIVHEKAKAAQAAIGGAVLVEDVAVDISALGGFPGPFVKFFQEHVGYDQCVHIAEAMGDDRAAVRCGVGYFDGARFLYAESVLSGRIVARRGEAGFGFDSYFIPDGHHQTFAEMGLEKKNEIAHRRKAIDMMCHRLKAEGVL